MKEGRRLGGVHAGPESKVLDGLSWEEVKNMQDAHTSQVTRVHIGLVVTGICKGCLDAFHQVDGYGQMKIGAASKGIIQRDFQYHATVFKSAYAKNPFDSVSNDELEEYKRIIDRWGTGSPCDFLGETSVWRRSRSRKYFCLDVNQDTKTHRNQI